MTRYLVYSLRERHPFWFGALEALGVVGLTVAFGFAVRWWG